MLDILLNDDGDISLGENGDIVLTESVRQAARVRLLWFFKEWKLGPDFGIPYVEKVLVKNPNIHQVEQEIAQCLSEISEVEDVRHVTIKVDERKRTAHIGFELVVSGDTIRMEVELNG